MSNSEQKPNKLSQDLSCGNGNAVKLRVHAEDVWHLALFTGTGLRTESNLTESGSAVPTTHLRTPPTHEQR